MYIKSSYRNNFCYLSRLPRISKQKKRRGLHLVYGEQRVYVSLSPAGFSLVCPLLLLLLNPKLKA